MKNLFLLSLLVVPTVADHTDITFDATLLKERLPKPLSDFTANIQDDRYVYLAGGCDNPLGNEFAGGFFACSSLSDSLYRFDTRNNEFTQLEDLPRARYRHAAVLVGKKIWLQGGRTIEDVLISEIDIYDIEKNEWTVLLGQPDQYLTSDHTGFAYENYAYFAGGWDQDYIAKNTVFRIDATSPTSLVIEDRAPLAVARGDIASAVDDNGDTPVAILSGGFTHEDVYCDPLEDVELYDFENDSWTEQASLGFPRADKAMVELDGQVFVLGGERNIDANGACAEPGELTVAIDAVERFDRETNTWEEVTELPNHRFRFAAVAVDSQKKIYTFGGQSLFNITCQCFRASDEVVVYQERSGSLAATVFYTLSAVLAVSTALML